MREHLSFSFLIYSLYVHVYFDTCTGKYVLQVEYVRTYLRTCIYMYIHAVCDNVRKYAQKTVYNRYNRQNYSRSARKEIITLHVCLTRWRTRMHMCDGIRNICDVTYTVLEMCVRLRRAYLCPERVLMRTKSLRGNHGHAFYLMNNDSIGGRIAMLMRVLHK